MLLDIVPDVEEILSAGPFGYMYHDCIDVHDPYDPCLPQACYVDSEQHIPTLNIIIQLSLAESALTIHHVGPASITSK